MIRVSILREHTLLIFSGHIGQHILITNVLRDPICIVYNVRTCTSPDPQSIYIQTDKTLERNMYILDKARILIITEARVCNLGAMNQRQRNLFTSRCWYPMFPLYRYVTEFINSLFMVEVRCDVCLCTSVPRRCTLWCRADRICTESSVSPSTPQHTILKLLFYDAPLRLAAVFDSHSIVAPGGEAIRLYASHFGNIFIEKEDIR